MATEGEADSAEVDEAAAIGVVEVVREVCKRAEIEFQRILIDMTQADSAIVAEARLGAVGEHQEDVERLEVAEEVVQVQKADRE